METIEKEVGNDILAQAIQQVKNVFHDMPSHDYLAGFQQWLKDRISDWEKTALRVGLVGITSAGKSTFINALAGEDILPRGAQPTSGLLVICRRFPRRKLTVLFKNNSQETYEDEDCTPVWVARYGDEKENPHNEQGVLELQLTLPGLMIPEKYDLIDSPGLDAFGLQGHEELTLRTMIPLVDVVLFLTTTKSTSDRENLKALDKICKEAKPAIVVQTHKDAVEPRYSKGGKIEETSEVVLEKHYQRVKQLLQQTAALQEAPIVQVSSIQALNARLENPGVPVDQLPEWEESGFAQIEAILRKLYDKLSQKIATRRMKLLSKEIQQLLERVKADYYSMRGKLDDAQNYKDAQFKHLQELQDSIPSEKTLNFPNSEKTIEEIGKVKDYFMQTLESGTEDVLENLSVQIRDQIKAIESDFFENADKIDSKLHEIAEQLSIDIEAIKPEQQQYQTLPQLKRYEKLVKVDVIQEAGFVGKAKRMFGKILSKEKWGYKQKDVVQTCINREALRDDLMDYYSIYHVKLVTYLKRWSMHWVNGVGAILTAITQRRDDLNQAPLSADPEPYRKLLNNIRIARDWIDSELSSSDKKRITMGFTVMKGSRAKTQAQMTVRTKSYLNLLMPLVHVSRIIEFSRKTHRFWQTTQSLLSEPKDAPIILISTPFSQEILDYLGILGDLPGVDEKDLFQNVVVYTVDRTLAIPGNTIPVIKHDTFGVDSRERWFLKKNHIVLFHDELLFKEGGIQIFSEILSKTDVVYRVIDLHQIGHEKSRLQNLPVRQLIEDCKNSLGYIGMGATRLLKSGQMVETFKSYQSLEEPPAFGLLPLLLGDGEDILNSLFWLGLGLETEGAFADEMQAMQILNRTQGERIKGKESSIRHLFTEIKEYKRECAWLKEHNL